MDKLVIEGGTPLKGEVSVSGSKNAVLPIMAATLLTDDACIIKNVPCLRDTNTMIKILRSLGKNVDFDKGLVTISTLKSNCHVADYKLVSTMRASFCVLGPLLGKLKKAKVSLPGGCVIGVRPVDLHLKGIKALGTHIDIEAGASDITVEIPKAMGCRIDASTGLSSNDFEGFTKVNNSYFSPDFEKATKKIFINISGGVSDFEVVRY